MLLVFKEDPTKFKARYIPNLNSVKYIMEEKIRKINSVIDEYFAKYPKLDRVAVKYLMKDFIKAGVYKKDYQEGLPLRNDLRDLDKAGQLILIPSLITERKTTNTYWFFQRTVNFKGEPFLDTSESIYTQLTDIASLLKNQLTNNEKSKIVSEVTGLIKDGNSFEEIWKVKPNNLREKNPKREFKGIYLFAEKIDNGYKPVYVGISQTIGRRFRGHTMSDRKQNATWAYMMAKFEHTHATTGKYDKMVSVPKAVEQKWITEKQKWIKDLRFTFYLINDNTLMHLAEVFCSAHLKCKWNTFETH